MEAGVLVGAREVVAHQDHHVLLAHLDVGNHIGVVLQLTAPFVEVESHIASVINDIIFEVVAIGERWWRRVVPEEYLSKDLLGRAEEVAQRFPQEDRPFGLL